MTNSKQDAEQILAAFSGNYWSIRDYFFNEVLRALSEEQQEFLLQTSILPRFTATLCDAILERENSAQLIEALHRGDLFLVPLDWIGSEWFRYQTLFAEVIQQEARKRLGDERLHTLAVAASLWYEQHELLTEAIETALNAATFPHAASLIQRYVESKENRAAAIRLSELNPLKQLAYVFRLAKLRWLLLASFFYAFPFAVMVTTLTVLMKDNLGWNATQAGFAATAVGVIDILVQGVLVGKLLTLFGDIKLSIGALILVAISYLLLGSVALIASPILLISGIILFAGASGLVENALRGMTSRMAGAKEQGRIGGASQSVQSLAAILGPLFGGLVYTQWGHFQAYAANALILTLAVVSVIMVVPSLRKHNTEIETSI